jgi:hypothetical protein
MKSTKDTIFILLLSTSLHASVNNIMIEKYACENFYFNKECCYYPQSSWKEKVESKAELIVKELIRQQEIEEEEKIRIERERNWDRDVLAQEKLNQRYIRLLEDDNGEIVRKIHAKAWKMYDINSTIEALYGKSFKKHPRFSVEEQIPSSSPYVDLSLKFPVKSIALLQKFDFEPSLIAYFNVSKESLVDQKVYIRIDAFHKKDIFVFVEDINGELFLWKEFYLSDDSRDCFGGTGGVYMLETYKKLKYEQQESVKLIKYKIKFKARWSDNGLLRAYIKFSDNMVSYVEAKRKEIPVQFISHIYARLNGKIVFDYYLSPFIDNRWIKFYVNNAKKSDVLDVFVEDIHGQTIHKSLVVKKNDKI